MRKNKDKINKQFVDDALLSDIANAIREKTGKTEEFKPSELKIEIEKIITPYSLTHRIPITVNKKVNDNVNIEFSTQPFYENKTFKSNDQAPLIFPKTVAEPGYRLLGTSYMKPIRGKWGDTINLKSNLKATKNIFNNFVWYLNNYCMRNNVEIKSLVSLPKNVIYELNGITPMESAYAAFEYGESLTSLNDLETTWDMSNIKNTSWMFGYCSQFKFLNLSKWNTSNVTDMSSMFFKCNMLKNINGIENLDISNVKNLAATFKECKSLTSLDLSNWNTGNILIASSLFEDCISLETLNLSNWKFNKDENKEEIYLDYLFNRCYNLQSIEGISNWNTSGVKSLYSMFYGCKSLTSLDLSNWNTSNVTNISSMFYNCNALTSLNLSNWDLNKIDLIDSNFVSTINSNAHINMSNWSNIGVTSFGGLFKWPKTVDVSNWNFKENSYLSYLFTADTSNNTYNSDGDNHNLTVLDISSWDTSNITSMASAFKGCPNINIIGLENLDTSNVTDMSACFMNSSKFRKYIQQTIDNTTKSVAIIDMQDISSWDTSNVENMSYMFCEYFGSDNSTTINRVSIENNNLIPYISNWDVHKVKNIAKMFYGWNIDKLDLSNWHFDDLENITGFISNADIDSVIIPNWNVTKVKDFRLSGFDENFDINESTGWSNGSRYPNCHSTYGFITDLLDISNWTIKYSAFNENYYSLNAFITHCYNLKELNISNLNIIDLNKELNFKLFNANNYLSKATLSSKSYANSKYYNYIDNKPNDIAPIKKINVSNWILPSTLTKISNIFNNAIDLETIIGLNTWVSSSVTNLDMLFYNCKKLKSIDLSGLNCEISSAFGTFLNCYSLEVLDIRNIKITGKLEYTFNNCYNLKYIIVSNPFDCELLKLNTNYKLLVPSEKLYDFKHFSGYNNIATNIDIIENYNIVKENGEITITKKETTESFNLYKYAELHIDDYENQEFLPASNEIELLHVKPSENMSYAFANCKNLVNLSMIDSMFEQTTVTDMSYMFYNCENLEIIDLSNIRVTENTNMENAFAGCTNLKYIIINSDEVFNLTDDNIGGLHYYVKVLVPSNLINSYKNHRNWSKLITESLFNGSGPAGERFANINNYYRSYDVNFKLILRHPDYLTNILNGVSKDVAKLHRNYRLELENLDILDTNPNFQSFKITTTDGFEKNWKFINATKLEWFMAYCDQLTDIDISNWKFNNKLTSVRSIFNQCRKIKLLDFSNWDFSGLTIPRGIGAYCNSLETIIFPENLYLSNVYSIQDTFNECYNLKNIINLPKIKTMYNSDFGYPSLENLFYDCKSIENFDSIISDWDVGGSRSYYFTFRGCESLKSINLYNWYSYVQNMQSMFSKCFNLENLKVYTLRVGTCTNFQYTFYSIAARILDLSYWAIRSDANLTDMFDGCNNLEYLIIANPIFHFNMNRSDLCKLNSNCKVLVPSNLLTTFKSATNWTSISDRILPLTASISIVDTTNTKYINIDSEEYDSGVEYDVHGGHISTSNIISDKVSISVENIDRGQLEEIEFSLEDYNGYDNVDYFTIELKYHNYWTEEHDEPIEYDENGDPINWETIVEKHEEAYYESIESFS